MSATVAVSVRLLPANTYTSTIRAAEVPAEVLAEVLAGVLAEDLAEVLLPFNISCRLCWQLE